MGTIAEKGAYTIETKSLLKQKINNLGGSIDDNTTFRQYANQLQNVYDNLPKTEYQEGTEINLGKTIKGKLDYENGVVGIGQTSQDGTPTPSTPIAINSVTGNQDVVVQNKNLCTEMEQGDVNTSTGEASSYQPTTSGFIRSKDYIPVKPSEVITVSYKNTATSGRQIVIFEYNANKTYIGFYYSNAPTYTRTLGNETAYIKIRLQDTTNTLSNNTEIQVEYGNTKTSYVEHQEHSYQLSLGDIELNAIGNYKDELIYDVENDKVYKNEKIEKVDITSARVFEFAQSSYGNYVQISVVRDFIKTSNIINVMSNIANATAYDDRLSNTDTYRILTYDTNVLQLRVPVNSGLDTIEQIKTLIDNSNMYALIKLATPTLTEITDTTLKDQVKALYNAHSLNGTTIITSNGNLPMIIKVRGLKGE